VKRLPALALLLLIGCGPDGPPQGAATAALHGAVHFDREPLTRTGNRLRVHLTDGSGQPVAGATVMISVVMAAHGHAAAAPAAQELAGGEYLFEPVNFTMAGSWKVTVTASKGELKAEQALAVISP